MSTETALHTPVNLQQRSKFCSAPLEIRDAIYGYLMPRGVHAYLRQGIFHVFACVEPYVDDGEISDDQDEETNVGALRYLSDPTWVRRLQSSWGPHWRCEEVALGNDHSHETASSTRTVMLQVCKTM
jgi:hypothetical protein